MPKRPKNLTRDLWIIALSVILAVYLVKSGVLHGVLASTAATGIIAAFIAGTFFTSVITTAPSIAFFIELAEFEPLKVLVPVGALGALFGDLVLFRFVKDTFADDLVYLFHIARTGRVYKILHSRPLRWLIPIVGALIIASPFPDEIGIVMLGLNGTRTRYFIPISLAMNALGIFIIVSLAA